MCTHRVTNNTFFQAISYWQWPWSSFWHWISFYPMSTHCIMQSEHNSESSNKPWDALFYMLPWNVMYGNCCLLMWRDSETCSPTINCRVSTHASMSVIFKTGSTYFGITQTTSEKFLPKFLYLNLDPCNSEDCSFPEDCSCLERNYIERRHHLWQSFAIATMAKTQHGNVCCSVLIKPTKQCDLKVWVVTEFINST